MLYRRSRILIHLAILVGLAVSPAPAQDCNGNGVDDATDIAQGTSRDCDGGGVPDECDTAIAFVEHEVGPGGTASSFPHDLDGDGDPDLVVAYLWDDRIDWHENLDGTGSYGPAITISTEVDAPIVAPAADLDGDGDLDVLSASAHNHRIAWYENLDGAGSFGAQNVIDSEFTWALSLATADIDGDGDLDVVASSNTMGQIAWYENLNGAGTFGTRQVAFNGPDAHQSVEAADVDGDGDFDLLSASKYGNLVAWYENTDGDGSFGPQQAIGTNFSPVFVVAVDIDSDGDLDALVAEDYPLRSAVVWFENLDGAGTFGPEQSAGFVDDPGEWIDPVDMDGDGDLDVVVKTKSPSSDVAWYENLDGSGTFGPKQLVPGAGSANAAFAADVDLDGVPDVVAALDWHENRSNDCNGNATPDSCDLGTAASLDCNLNAVPDECDLATALSFDCDLSSVPDECETACGPSCDLDGDRCPDDLDCAPSDAGLWSAPVPIGSLMLDKSASAGRLFWSPPLQPGGTAPVLYDTLRSAVAFDFFGTATCLESDETDRLTLDGSDPGPGETHFYLIRVENGCGEAVGADSQGVARAMLSCP